MFTTLRHRLRWLRNQWNMTVDDLSDASGIDVSEIRRIESGTIRPDNAAYERLANVFQVNETWLRNGLGEMLHLHNMSADDQVREQTGPGSEGLPGFVVEGDGPWVLNERGEWQVRTPENRDF